MAGSAQAPWIVGPPGGRLGWFSHHRDPPPPESKCGRPGEGAQAPALCQGRLLERKTPSIGTQA